MRSWFAGAVAAVLPMCLAAQSIPDHRTFESVLQQHVHGPLVDYGALQADRNGLDQYLEALSQTDPQLLSDASPAERLSFWINAYNACALTLVINHYPIKKRGFPASLMSSLKGVPGNSIRQISNTWEREFCPVAGTNRSLDEIEHRIIRPIGEPRIHFALNCASRSCPVLSGSAYTASELEAQLDEAVMRFVSDSLQYRLSRGDKPLITLSKVLDWYKDDFGGTEGVVEFLIKYVVDDDAAYIRSQFPMSVEYEDYDWTLNDTTFAPQRN